MKNDDFKEITAEELENVSGGFVFGADSGESGLTAKKTSVTCIYCGREISLGRKGKTTGTQFKCECGAYYSPTTASQWIPPKN